MRASTCRHSRYIATTLNKIPGHLSRLPRQCLSAGSPVAWMGRGISLLLAAMIICTIHPWTAPGDSICTRYNGKHYLPYHPAVPCWAQPPVMAWGTYLERGANTTTRPTADFLE